MSDKTMSSKQKRRQEQAEAEKRQKKLRVKIIVFIAAFALVTAAILVLNSAGFYRNVTAVKINDTEWTIADFNFHFSTQQAVVLTEFTELAGDDTSKLPDLSKSLKTQVFNEETGETWHEYFTGLALDTMREVTMLCDEAEAAGFTLDDEDELTITNEINNLEIYAGTYGYEVNAFVTMQYGKGVNTDVYRKNMEKIYLAESYAMAKEDSFEYEDAVLDAYYDENADDYDIYEYRIFFAVDEDKAEAEKIANEFAGKVTDEASFAELCREYSADADAERYEDDSASKSYTSGRMLANTYKDWMMSDERKEGDVKVFESATGYYVVYYVARENNDYNSVDIEYALLATANYSIDNYENEEAYNKAVKENYDAVAADAQKVYDAVVEGADMDTIKKDYEDHLYECGNYEGVSLSTFEKEDVNEWLFSADRKAGDTKMFEVRDGQFYVMRYVGTNDLCSRLMAKNDKVREDYQLWLDEVLEAYTVKTTVFRGLAN